jgi:hypothetical protein
MVAELLFAQVEQASRDERSQPERWVKTRKR